jgi:hypothetical protein
VFCGLWWRGAEASLGKDPAWSDSHGPDHTLLLQCPRCIQGLDLSQFSIALDQSSRYEQSNNYKGCTLFQKNVNAYLNVALRGIVYTVHASYNFIVAVFAAGSHYIIAQASVKLKIFLP